jgi:ribonuclease PH
MDVNEWISYECSDEGTCTRNIRYSSTRSHAAKGENRTRNRSENCKCKQALRFVIFLCRIPQKSIILFVCMMYMYIGYPSYGYP